MNKLFAVIFPIVSTLSACDSAIYDAELSSKLTGGTYQRVHPPSNVYVYKSETMAFLSHSDIDRISPGRVLSDSEITRLGEIYEAGYSPVTDAPNASPEDTDFFHVIFSYDGKKLGYHVIEVSRTSRIAYIRPFDLSGSVSGNTEVGQWLAEHSTQR